MACNCKKKKINTETNNTIPLTQTIDINNTIKKEKTLWLQKISNHNQ